MDDLSISARILAEAEYIVEHGATVRATAKKFGISKSSVHKDVSYKLAYIDERLFNECASVLKNNLRERHIRGGNATKRKFESLRRLSGNKHEKKRCDK